MIEVVESHDIILGVLAAIATLMTALSVWQKNRIDAAKSVADAAVLLLKPMSKRIDEMDKLSKEYQRNALDCQEKLIKLQVTVDKLRVENTELKGVVDTLVGQVESLGHTPVRKKRVTRSQS